MLSKFFEFVDNNYNHKKKFKYFVPNEHKSMEWQDDEKDFESIHSISWTERNALEKSKSDSSITAIGDCNYRTQGIQVSLEDCDVQTNVKSALENLDIHEDEEEIDECETNFKSIITKDYHNCNHIEYNALKYRFTTHDLTTRQLIIQEPEILNFQGNRHLPEEISRNWKKDCRMWLWKSFRFAAYQQHRMQVDTTIN